MLGDVQLLGGGLILDTSPITGKVFFKVPSPSLLSLPFAGLLCACMCFLWSSSSRFLSSVHRAFLMKKIRLGRYCFIVILLHSSPAHCVVYLPIGCAFFIGVAGTFFCFLLQIVSNFGEILPAGSRVHSGLALARVQRIGFSLSLSLSLALSLSSLFFLSLSPSPLADAPPYVVL